MNYYVIPSIAVDANGEPAKTTTVTDGNAQPVATIEFPPPPEVKLLARALLATHRLMRAMAMHLVHRDYATFEAMKREGEAFDEMKRELEEMSR